MAKGVGIPHPDGKSIRVIMVPRTGSDAQLTADEEIMLALHADVERLTAQAQDAERRTFRYGEEAKRLKSEVERLASALSRIAATADCQRGNAMELKEIAEEALTEVERPQNERDGFLQGLERAAEIVEGLMLDERTIFSLDDAYADICAETGGDESGVKALRG